MIRSYPNYLDQTQSIGINGVVEWNGIGVAIPCSTGGMVVSYPNYLDQTQSIGINSVVEWNGIGVDTPATPYPLNIRISKALEYGISISKTGGGS